MGWVSTTGVYGDSDGNWVSEKNEPNHFKKKPKRLNCENEWIQSNLPIQIFRLPGIYGPGRSTFETIRNNKIKIIFKDNQVFQGFMSQTLQMQ